MKKMKYAKIALAAVISAALLQGGTALAKKKGELSVYEWGPWAVMARPAAGPQFVTFTPKGNPDPYHPTPVPVPQGPCTAGQPCGWATYSLFTKTSYNEDSGSESTTTYSGSLLARFALSIQSLQNPADDASTTEPSFRYMVDSPINLPSGLKTTDYPSVASQWLPGFITSNQRGDVFNISNKQISLPSDVNFIYGWTGKLNNGSSVGGAVLGSNPWDLDIVVGGWKKVESTTDSNGNTTTVGTGTSLAQSDYFIYGTTTNLAALDRLHARSVKATYTGFTLVNQTPLTINVYFDSRTWDGHWNNGHESSLVIKPDRLGVYHATGHMRIDASGPLSGPNLIVHTISGGKGVTITPNSVLQNAVFGNNARVVAGGYQMTEKTAEYPEGFTQSDITVATR